jgi:hypothetical protein
VPDLAIFAAAQPPTPPAQAGIRLDPAVAATSGVRNRIKAGRANSASTIITNPVTADTIASAAFCMSPCRPGRSGSVLASRNAVA